MIVFKNGLIVVIFLMRENYGNVIFEYLKMDDG